METRFRETAAAVERRVRVPHARVSFRGSSFSIVKTGLCLVRVPPTASQNSSLHSSPPFVTICRYESTYPIYITIKRFSYTDAHTARERERETRATPDTHIIAPFDRPIPLLPISLRLVLSTPAYIRVRTLTAGKRNSSFFFLSLPGKIYILRQRGSTFDTALCGN